eukprot:8629-Eustigmatos_ZCMA.PRE.1
MEGKTSANQHQPKQLTDAAYASYFLARSRPSRGGQVSSQRSPPALDPFLGPCSQCGAHAAM